MELSPSEQAVLERYHQKTRMAGGPRTGFVLRQEAIVASAPGGADLAAALDPLADKGLLAASEDRRFYFLTEAGAELLTGWDEAR